MDLELLIHKVEHCIGQIEADARFHYKPAQVDINAPLALIQVELDTKYSTLMWVYDQLTELNNEPVMEKPAFSKEEIIKQNPLYLECPHCGHKDIIYGATAIPEERGCKIIFGSAADFCTKCDKPWGRNTH